MFTPIETFAATAWAWIAFSEQPPSRTFIGGAIVLAGLLYGTMNRSQLGARKRAKTPT